MIVLAITWFWITINAFLWGFAVMAVIERHSGYRIRSLGSVCIAGLCMLTLYAGCFSLLSGVGNIGAQAGLIMADILVILILRKKMLEFFRSIYTRKEIILVIVLAMLVFSLIYPAARVTPRHYDTYLYHAQAIHWIEDYGVVPGLGNLHNRFAYNSSFLCFQALFSMKALLGHSTHTANAVVAWILIIHAIYTFSFWKNRYRFMPSDFLRAATLSYYLTGETLEVLSSPSTDLMVLGLILYIFTEWVSLYERHEKEITPYALLCMLGVFSVSLKLSALFVAILSIKPMVMFFRKKQYLQILFYVVLGLILISPYLIRNIIISGYLIYPYPELDLFSVDWKMNAFTALVDRVEIRTWSWGVKNWRSFDKSVFEWVPLWWDRNLTSPLLRLLMISHIVMVPTGVYMGIRNGVKPTHDEKDSRWDLMLIVSVMFINLLFFLFSAPHKRYGGVYISLLPLFVTGVLFQRLEYRMRIYRLASISLIIGILFMSVTSTIASDKKNGLVYTMGYGYYDAYKEGKELSLNGLPVWVPVKGDQISYEFFPSTPRRKMLSVIELRGESLKEGFRIKEEYRDTLLIANGKISEDNPFS